VFYSRSIWGQDMLAPLAMLWRLGAYGASRPWQTDVHVNSATYRFKANLPVVALFASVFVACFAPQVHYAGLALIPATILVGLRFQWWRRWKAVLAGIALAAVCALPFILALARDSGMRIALRSMLKAQPQYDLTSFSKWVEMGTGLRWEALLLGPSWNWPQPVGWLLGVTHVILCALSSLGLGVLIWQAFRRRRLCASRLATLGLALSLVPPIIFVRHTTPVYVQYQLTALPALCLGVGALAGAGWWQARQPGTPPRQTRFPLIWGPTITLLALIVAVVQAFAVGQGIQTMLQRATIGGLGTPLYYPRAAGQALRAASIAYGGGEIVVLTPGDDPASIADVDIFKVLLWGAPYRVVDGSSVLLIPGATGTQTTMFSVFSDLGALDEARAAGIVASERTLPRRVGEPPYVSWQTAGTPQSFQVVAPQTLANGAVLMGYRIRRVGDKLRLTTWWQLSGSLVAGDYHQFNHLYGADGQTMLEGQDRALSSQAWRSGDTLITWVDFAVPTDQTKLWLEVGMYTWPNLERIAILDPGNHDAAIRLGPIASWN
jgi:hypothetical protein